MNLMYGNRVDFRGEGPFSTDWAEIGRRAYEHYRDHPAVQQGQRYIRFHTKRAWLSAKRRFDEAINGPSQMTLSDRLEEEQEKRQHKRPREDTATTTASKMFNITQVATSGQRFGHKRRTSFKKLVREVRSEHDTQVVRAQSLSQTSFSDGWGTLPLSNKIGDTGDFDELPLYFFNLNQPPAWTAKDYGAETYHHGFAEACIRLHMNNINGDFVFWNNAMTHSSPGGQAGMGYCPEIVKVDDSGDVPAVRADGLYNTGQNFRHNWSSMNMVLYGAKNRPVKFHVSLIRFKDGMRPQRHFYKAVGTETPVLTVNSEDPPLNNDQKQEWNLWWRKYLAPRVHHPLRTTKNEARCPYEVLKHEVIKIGAEMSIDKDTAPMQFIKKMFFRNDREYSTIDATTNLNSNWNEIDIQVPNVHYDVVHNGRGVREGIKAEDQLYLMVFAESFYQYPRALPLTNEHCPSMDIVIRNSFSYKNSQYAEIPVISPATA